jgi:hypothetical protein
MEPRPIYPNRGAIYQTQRHIKRVGTVRAQPRPLRGWIEQEPKRHALAEGCGVFLSRISIGLVKCTSVNHGPVVLCPFRRASPIGATARISIFRAVGPALAMAGEALAPAPTIITCTWLVSHRAFPGVTSVANIGATRERERWETVDPSQSLRPPPGTAAHSG